MCGNSSRNPPDWRNGAAREGAASGLGGSPTPPPTRAWPARQGQVQSYTRRRSIRCQSHGGPRAPSPICRPRPKPGAADGAFLHFSLYPLRAGRSPRTSLCVRRGAFLLAELAPPSRTRCRSRARSRVCLQRERRRSGVTPLETICVIPETVGISKSSSLQQVGCTQRQGVTAGNP